MDEESSINNLISCINKLPFIEIKHIYEIIRITSEMEGG